MDLILLAKTINLEDKQAQQIKSNQIKNAPNQFLLISLFSLRQGVVSLSP